MINMRVDMAAVDKGINEIQQNLSAVAATLNPHGRAEVVTSKRRKMPHERGNRRKGIQGVSAPAGHHIANFLRDKGHDPFALPESDFADVDGFIASETAAAVDEAQRTGRQNTTRLKRALIAGAMHLEEITKRRILAGQLGSNNRKYIRKKFLYVERGWVLPGSPKRIPPYGYLTGRFYHGIRWRWRQGYRPGGR